MPPAASAVSGGGRTIGRLIIGLGLAAFVGVLGFLIVNKVNTTPVLPAGSPNAAAASVTPTALQAAQPAPIESASTANIELKPIEPVAQVAPVEMPTAAPTKTPRGTTRAPNALPHQPAGAPDPLFAPDYDAKDGLPVMVCGIKPKASSLTLIDMQARGLDVKHGFHLALVPLELNEAFNLSDAEHMPRLGEGKWDCMVETLEELSTWDVGVATAIVGEDTSESGIWARDVNSFYELRNKSIGFVTGSSAEYFLNYMLALMPEESRATVRKVGFDSPTEAVAAFNAGELDGVSAWGRSLLAAADSGGKPILLARQLRSSTDAVLMSRQIIKRDEKLVQAFHRAYFESLRDQVENPGQSANAIAAWGNNAYTGVSLGNAIRDYEGLMKGHAIASLAQNLTLMKDMTVLVAQMEAAREISRFGGATVVTLPVKDQLDGRFILALEPEKALRTKQLPIDPTFSLARDEETKSSPGGASAELPCRNFTFKPSSTELTEDSKKIIDICVLPALRTRAETELKIIGSAAWPSGNSFDEAQIKNFGLQRAQSISQYLASKGIDVKRLKIDSVLPPVERRDISDESKLAQDRFVEMTVIAPGW